MDASWVLLICRRGELGGPPVPVVCVLLICRKGDEAWPVLPFAVIEGLEASCVARLLRGVFCDEDAAAFEGPAAGLLLG